jgi:flagellar biogenesis protein FliO
MRHVAILLMCIVAAPASAEPEPSTPAPRRRPARPAGPTLAELVAIDATTPQAVPADTAPVPSRSVSEAPTTGAPSRSPALVATPTPSSSTTLPSPWAALGLLGVLAGGAGVLWWQRRQQAGARGQRVQVREVVHIAPRRQLLLVEVGQRCVLLSSTEAGIAMLMECPREGVRPSFGDELHRLIAEESARREPLPSPIGAPAHALRGDAEASEIMRRLGKSA